ncbi:protein kinase [Streptomyces sp. NPDC057950]|uniref:serine/threonine protein kinase n=1 Tax=Streptomyces sp. NPDC057950 TaxID=3346288 RepID=UPI0036EA0866
MGEVFAGRYELVDPIGHGGVGAVWRAWDRRRRRYVAAKVLQQSDAHALLRFVREQALRIDHPHVLAPASWAADDDKVLFTMDLVAGGSLVHLVNDYGPLPPAFVCTLLDQLLAGLAAVHAEGVVHRDIKPANVLLEATGTARPRLRLSDFGISMRLGEPRLTETDYVVGTPGYFAPEQMMGAEPDFPADLFAVGLVALYLLEGAKPDAKALIEYFAENGTPTAPQGIPEPLWQVVATLLQPDPQARFRTATGARKALASAAELLPEPGPDDELVEVFDQVGPLPSGFGPTGPTVPTGRTGPTGPAGTAPGTTADTASRPGTFSGPAAARGTDPDQVPLPDRSLPSGRSPAHGRGAVPDEDPAPGTGSTPGRRSAPGPDPRSVPGPDPGSVPAPGPASGWDAVEAAWPGTAAPGDVTPRPAPDSVTPRPSTMSDTGSFLLPPPRAAAPQEPPRSQSRPQPTPQPRHQPPSHDSPQQQPQPQPQPQHAWHETQRRPVPGHPWRPPEQPPTPPTAVNVPSTTPAHAQPFGLRSAPVPVPQRPADPTVVVQQHLPGSAGSHRAVSRRAARPGPPRRVAVPLLLLALACFAVGFWALTRL